MKVNPLFIASGLGMIIVGFLFIFLLEDEDKS